MDINKVSIWNKLTLTINEASQYSNIGINRLCELTKDPACDFVLYVGRKKLIKRCEFENYIKTISEV